jgi:hypothetical protein
MAPPECRRRAPEGSGTAPSHERLGGELDPQNIRHWQAAQLTRRFGLKPPIARLVASLTFGEASLTATAAARARVIETLSILQEWFPAAFVGLTAPRRPPLKISVHHDIVARAPAIEAREAHAALRYYVGGFAYLRAMVEGATRLDLDSEPAGAVTAHEAAGGKDKIGRIERKAAAAPPTPAPHKPPERPLAKRLASQAALSAISHCSISGDRCALGRDGRALKAHEQALRDREKLRREREARS